MRVEIWRCDNCAREYKKGGGGEVLIAVAGKGVKCVDLCTQCLTKALESTLRELSDDQRAVIAERFQEVPDEKRG